MRRALPTQARTTALRKRSPGQETLVFSKAPSPIIRSAHANIQLREIYSSTRRQLSKTLSYGLFQIPAAETKSSSSIATNTSGYDGFTRRALFLRDITSWCHSINTVMPAAWCLFWGSSQNENRGAERRRVLCVSGAQTEMSCSHRRTEVATKKKHLSVFDVLPPPSSQSLCNPRCTTM